MNDQIDYVLLSIIKSINKEKEEFIKKNDLDLTVQELETLDLINYFDFPSMSYLASHLKITQGTLTTSITRLVKKGLCKRINDDNDKRKILLDLTVKGGNIIDEYDIYKASLFKKALSDINIKNQNVLEECLIKINDTLNL